MIKMIVAVSSDLAIGMNNSLMWHIPEDLSFFKSETLDGIVVMGSKTRDSLPLSYLPNRRNIVLSRKPVDDNFVEYMSVDEVIKLSLLCDVYIIGGGEIYNLFAELASEILVTHVEFSEPRADTFFPDILANFDLIEEVKAGVSKGKGNLKYSIKRYQKVTCR